MVSTASIADVYVTVLPETGKIADGIKRALFAADKDVRNAAWRWKQQIEATLKGTKVEVKVKADSKQAQAEIEKVAKDKKATVGVDADTGKAEADIDRAARDRKVKMQADFDTAYARRAGQLAAQAVAEGVESGTGAASEAFKATSRSAAGMGTAIVAGVALAVPALTVLAGVAAAASGALLLIPAAFAAVGAGAGVLTLGLSGITDAYEAVGAASKDAGKDAKDHARNVQSAHRSVESASRSLNSAIKAEESAQKDVARARRDALHELQDINDELRNGAIDETQAQLDLAKARDELATGTFESSLDYQQAQLNVIKAEQRLKEAHEGNIDLETEVQDKRAKGVDGADEVVAAEDRLATAQQNTAAAQTALADAQTQLAEANNEVSTSAQKAADAMGGLSPNAQALVNSLIGLQPLWEAFRNSLQDPLTAGLGDTITDTVNAVLPAVLPGLQRIAGAFNTMFKNIGEWLQDPENLAMLETIVNNIATAFEKLAPVVDPLLTAFATLTEAGSGFLPDLTEKLVDAVNDFADFITRAQESGALDEFIQTGLDTLGQLADILPHAVDLFERLIPLGEKWMPILVNLVNKFLDFMGALTNFWTEGTRFDVFFSVILPGALQVFTTAINIVAGVLKFLGNVFDVIKVIGGNFADKLIDKFGRAKDRIINDAGQIRKALYEMLPESVKQKWEGFWNGLKIVTEEAVKFIKQKMQELKDFLIGLLPTWAQGLIKIGGDLINNPSNDAASGGTPIPKSSSSGNVSGGVPGLHEKSPGKWTSTDKAWADLIEAESGGVPDITQQIQDVNSGGNEAEGLFQITPETWRANGGEEFAKTPKLATPAEQGIVAMRILQKNPSGSDWGPVDRGEVAAPSLGSSVSTPTPSTPGAPTSTAPGAPTGAPSAITSQRVPYGLPAGTDIRQGAAGFPQWVYDLGAQFNLVPSTYAGHQEGSGQNQGIDWWGTTEDLQRFAEYLEANPDLAEQVIFSNPETGEKTGMVNGQKVGPGTSQPGYYANDWKDHEKHVHTRFSMSASGGGTPGSPNGGPTGISTSGDSHTIQLDPNVPLDRQKTDGKGYGKNLGQDIISGMMEIFGLGDLFPDPTQFGLFKIFKSLLGLKPASGDSNGGSTNAGEGSGNGGGLLDVLGGLVPNINGTGGPGGWFGNTGQFGGQQTNATVDNSQHLTLETNNKGDGKFIMDTVNTNQLNNQRSNIGAVAGK